MKGLFFLILISLSVNILSCPTQLAHDLLGEDEICFRDVNKHVVTE